MAEWRVNTSDLRSQSSDMLDCASQLTSISQGVQTAGNLSGFSFSGKAVLQSRIDSLRHLIDQESSAAKQMGGQLAQIAEIYDQAEREITGNNSEGAVDFEVQDAPAGGTAGAGAGGETGNQGTGNGGGQDSIEDVREWAWNMLQSIMKTFDKVFENDNAGLGASILDYLSKAFAFFGGGLKGMKGWAGLANLCELGDVSSDVWSGVYDVIKAGLKGKNLEDFTAAYGSKVAGFSVLGSMIGLFGGIATFLNSDSTTLGDRFADFLEAGEGGIDLYKSVYEYRHLAETVENGGVYTAAGLYATTAEAVVSTLARMYRSIGEYGADGDWSLMDTASTGIDSSIAGLEAIISSLSFGVISEETIGMTTEEMSDAVKQWAGDIGKEAGNYIARHPDMLNKYQNGTVFDRIGLTMEATAKNAARHAVERAAEKAVDTYESMKKFVSLFT